jgi:glycosyltransferase involved in cell wall biosynthesis
MVRNKLHDVPDRVAVIHTGTFSGSATSLMKALQERMEVVDCDLLPVARHPRMMSSRLAGVVEARRAGSAIPWTKTGAWSRGLQRCLERNEHLQPGQRILFVQTLAACELDERIPYSIYTDGVGLEGASVGERFASKFTDSWIAREQTFLRRARHISVMGPNTKQVLVRQYEIPTEKVSVVGAGPNVPVGRTRWTDRCQRLIFIGIEWERKGGPDLLVAFQKVRRLHPDLRLLIIGTEVQGVLPDGVEVVGRVPHPSVSILLSNSDAVVIPSHKEPFGIALLEGLLTGLPCIGSTVGNQRWLIGDAGLCVSPGDVTGLAEAITDLVGNYDSYRSRALRRREVLGPSCNWPAVAERILANLP